MFFYWILTCLFAVFLIFTVFMLLFYEWRSPSFRKRCRMLPGPKRTFLFGISLELASLKPEDTLVLAKHLSDTYGDVCYFEVLGLPQLILMDLDDIATLLNSSQCITKGSDYKILAPWLCEGLLLSSGTKWHSRRKLLTPTFHFKVLEYYIPVFNRIAKSLTRRFLIDSAIDSKSINIESYISRCTLDSICETAMAVSLDNSTELVAYVNAIRRICVLAQIRFLTFWMYNDWLFNLSATGREFHKIVKQLHNFTKNVVQERKKIYKTQLSQQDLSSDTDIGVYKKRVTFLDCLIEMQNQNPEAMTDDDIREEVDTFMFEGYDTTSTAIIWALFMIATHPDVQEKLQREMKCIFDSSERDATFDDLRQMQYLEMVIKETLRLYPSVNYFTRYLTSDVKIKQYTIPATTNVAVIPYLVHRNPKIYPDPERFDPDRFLPHVASSRHPCAFLGFSAGYRNCIGQKYAIMELKVILSTIVRKFSVHTTLKKEDVGVLPIIVLRPNQDIYLSFKLITDAKQGD